MAAASLTIATHTVMAESYTQEELASITPQMSKEFVQDFYNRMGSSNTVNQCSALKEKSYKTGKFLVAKCVVETSVGQAVMGVVYDESHDYISVIPVPTFNQFLATGSRSYLLEYNLAVE